MTRDRVGDEYAHSTFQTIEYSKYVSEVCWEKNKALYKKFRPIEQDPNISKEEKIEKVVEWWVWDLDNIVDENITEETMRKIPLDTWIFFRHGVD